MMLPGRLFAKQPFANGFTANRGEFRGSLLEYAISGDPNVEPLLLKAKVLGEGFFKLTARYSCREVSICWGEDGRVYECGS